MYAIVDIAGQQFKVEKDSKLYVHRLDAEAGKKVQFDKVLLIDNDGKVNIGSPVIEGASIAAEVVSHVRGDKVKVFKKKRRKGYQKLNGHRQDFTEILIQEIIEKGAKKAAAPKAKAEEPVKEEEKVTAKAEPKAESKKAAPKKETKAASEKTESPKAKAKKEDSKSEE